MYSGELGLLEVQAYIASLNCNGKAPREELDPYEQLEMDLDPQLTEVEVVLELLGRKVLERLKKVTTEVAAFEASYCCRSYCCYADDGSLLGGAARGSGYWVVEGSSPLC